MIDVSTPFEPPYTNRPIGVPEEPLRLPTTSRAGTPPIGTPPGWTPPPPVEPSARPRGRARFATGLFAGIALTGAAVGGGYAIGHDSSTPSRVTANAPAAQTISADVPAGSAIGQLVAAARPSIVSVHQTVSETTPMGTREGTAAGTGFVLSADGYLVTNNHVIADGTHTTVTFDDGSSAPATVVAADPTHDLAVLKVDRKDLTPLAIGNSDDVQLGDPLIAVGYALDLHGEPSVTAGILSAKDRTITEENGEQLVNLLQTDTAINPGNSGGPLLNGQGEVVGINTAIAGQAQNIGFAIAITPVQHVIDSLRGGSVPERALMGVTSQPSDDPTIPGAVVVKIADGSGAAASGLRVGDIIKAVDGTSISDPSALGAVIATHQPNDEIKVTVDRKGTKMEITITLGVKPT